MSTENLLTTENIYIYTKRHCFSIALGCNIKIKIYTIMFEYK